MLRRNLLSTASLLALGGCGAFTLSTANGVTTVTINVAQIDSWAQAFKNGAKLILGLPGILPMLGSAGNVAFALIDVVATDIRAFDVAASGSATLSVNLNNVPDFISTVLADGQMILGTITKALPDTAIVGTAATYLNALATVVSLFEAMLGVAPAAAPRARMSETAALALLNVSAK